MVYMTNFYSIPVAKGVPNRDATGESSTIAWFAFLDPDAGVG